MGSRTIITTIALLVLAGCATTNVPPPKEILTPVLSCPAPPVVERPKLLAAELEQTDINDPGKVVQIYAATILQLQGYAEQLEAIVETYKKAAQEVGDVGKRLEKLRAEPDGAKPAQ